MSTFQPRLDVLPAAQRALWSELRTVPRTFVLYGGTGLALRLGHRTSVDFDFFAHAPLDHRALQREIAFLREAQTVQEEPDARTVIVTGAEGPVKVSFFGNVDFGRVGVPDRTADGSVWVASLLDLAGTKVKVLLQRIERKDYEDVAALLASGVSIEQVLGAAMTLFGPSFNPLVAQKTIAYFEGPGLQLLPERTRELLVAHAARDLRLVGLPRTSARLEA